MIRKLIKWIKVMKEKKCTLCGTVKPLEQFYWNRTLNRHNSRCKECECIATVFRHKEMDYVRDGFSSEKEHFNAALEHYAEVFNMPQLLKYKRK